MCFLCTAEVLKFTYYVSDVIFLYIRYIISQICKAVNLFNICTILYNFYLLLSSSYFLNAIAFVFVVDIHTHYTFSVMGMDSFENYFLTLPVFPYCLQIRLCLYWHWLILNRQINISICHVRIMHQYQFKG